MYVCLFFISYDYKLLGVKDFLDELPLEFIKTTYISIGNSIKTKVIIFIGNAFLNEMGSFSPIIFTYYYLFLE